MKQTNRIISLVLAFAMVFTMLQGTVAFAADGAGRMSSVADSRLADDEPTDPPEPTDPTEPTEPTEPTDPTEPEDPTDPTEPEDPVMEYVVISGDVLDENKQPLTDFLVTVESPEEVMDGETSWAHQEFPFVDSHFEITVPKGHAYTITVTANGGYEPYSEKVDAQEDVSMDSIILMYVKVSVDFSLVNASAEITVTDPDGKETAYPLDASDVISVRTASKIEWIATANAGCELLSYFEVDGDQLPNEDGTCVIERCEKDLSVVIRAEDKTAPVITSIDVSDSDVWTKSKTVTIVAEDNCDSANDIKVYISKNRYENAEAVMQEATQLPDCRDVATENGTYYVYAVDSALNMATESFEVDHIDRTAPVISDLKADTYFWSIKVTYSFHAEDNTEVARVFWISADGKEHDLALTQDGNYQFTVNKNGDISVVVEDVAGNRTVENARTENIDDLPPEITDVVVQEKWDTEKNLVIITVSDNAEIDSVTIVDAEGTETVLEPTAEDGKYQFVATANGTYKVVAVDIVGNESSVEFVVDRIDNEPPVLTSVVKTPDSDWTNQAVDVEIHPTDTQSGIKAVYVLTADAMPENFNADEWTEVSADEEGRYIYHVDNDTDKTFKLFVVCTDNLDHVSAAESVEVKIDVTAPVVSDAVADAETWSQEITYTFTASDNGEIATVTWILPDGTETALPASENGRYEMKVTENGEHKIRVADKAGNVTEQVVNVSLVDREAPEITSVVPQSAWHAYRNNVEITVNDNREIKRVYVVDPEGNETDLNLDGDVYNYVATMNGEYKARAIDVAENESETGFTVDHIDTEAPEITNVTVEPDNAWTAEVVKITLTVSDSQSGVKTVRVAKDGDMEETPDPKDWEEVQVEEDGTFTYTIQNDKDSDENYHFVCEDNVGRFSEIKSFNIKVDITAPMISGVEASTDIWSREITYTFKVADNGEMKSVTCTTPSGKKTEFELNDAGAYEFTAIENGDFVIEAVDMAGNVSTKTVSVKKVDRTDPQIESVNPQTAWDATKNVVVIKATDNAEMSRVYVTDAAGNEHDLAAGENGLYEFVTQANGEYTVIAVDVATNSSSKAFTVNHIDTEKPTIAHISKDPDAQWTTHEVRVTIDPADTQSGVKAVYASAESSVAPTDDISKWTAVQKDESGKYVFTIPNNADSLDTYNFIVEDNVGRLSEIETFVIGIDVNAPVNVKVEFARDDLSGFFKELTAYTPFAMLYRDVVTVKATAEDAFCGVNRFEYQVVKEGETLSDDGWKSMTLPKEGDTRSAFVLIRDKDFIAEIYVRVYDNLGNCTQAITNTKDGKTVLCVLENTPDEYDERAEAPALTARTESPDGVYEEGKWTNANVWIHAESKGAVSGVMKYQYQIVPVGQKLNENGWIDLEPSRRDSLKADIRLTEDANVDVYMRTVSHAENASKYSRVRVRIQKTLPNNAAVAISGNMGTNNWYIALPTITIAPPTVSEIAAPVTTYYDLHRSGAGSDAHQFGTNKPVISSDGVYELSVWTVDEAGNMCANVYRKTIYVDTTAPTDLALNIGQTSILAQNNGHSIFNLIFKSNITVTAGANCDISGMASLSYQKVYNNAAYKENGSWAPWPANGLVIQPNENCVIYLKAVDNAGNATIVHSDGIIVDNTAPQGEGKEELSLTIVGANAEGYFPGDAAVDVSIVDPVVNNAMSGLKEISYQVITDGVTTQNETITVATNGENIQRTGFEAGNNDYISAWKGRITVKAALNNSDNIIVTVTAVDQAGNSRTTSTSLGAIKIDTTAPTVVMSYDNNTADTELDGAYFDADRTLTIRVTERDFEDRLGSLHVTRNGADYPVNLQWTKTAGKSANGDDNVYTASVTIHEDGVYRVSFDAQDYAGNKAASIVFADGTLAGDNFIIDQTAPVLTVSYDNNDVKNGTFFDAKRIATITVKDVNFAEERFVCNCTAMKDGASIKAPALSAWIHNGDLHTATITYADDGDYTFSASVTDKAGNKTETVNYGASEAPEAFTVDTTPVEVAVDGLEKNTAYAGSLKPTITFGDINFADYSVSLTMTNMEIKDKDVTDKFIKREDGKLLLDFDGEENNDGIYILKYSFTDKAGHVTEDTYKFTVNRNGSVYEYSRDLLDLINQYVRHADGVYTITEYNPSKVTKSTLIITCDGDPNESVIWDTQVVNENGANWYQYVHTIDPSNYLRDGKYRTTLSSEDGAENKTENTNSGKPEIVFWVDTTAPEITSVTGMEEAIVNAPKKEIKMSFYDTIGMANIKIYVSENGGNEKLVFEKDTFTTDEETTFETSIVLEEGLRQHVRIVVTDKAGNTTDTDQNGLNSAIKFVDNITVSENFFVRWYANPWVFFGSISGILVLVAGSVGGILAYKKKKKDKKPGDAPAEEKADGENDSKTK